VNSFWGPSPPIDNQYGQLILRLPLTFTQIMTGGPVFARRGNMDILATDQMMMARCMWLANDGESTFGSVVAHGETVILGRAIGRVGSLTN
jgi:hypothetical protein